MKITKEYLREIIKEAVEEAERVGTKMQGKITKHSKTLPSSGYRAPRDVDPTALEAHSQKFKIKKLAKVTGVERRRNGEAFKTELAPKGYYVTSEYEYGEPAMYGPFDTEEAAREFIRGEISSMRKFNKRTAATYDLKTGKYKGEPPEELE